MAAAFRRLDSRPELIAATQRARRRLPGDSLYGDPLSMAGTRAPELLGRQLAALAGERPSVVRELGFGALQLWQGISEAQGRGFGDRELAIMFTDIVDFSAWALTAGDERALELLRAADLVLAECIEERGGEVVKRLGDGLMAVFADPRAALEAAQEACVGVARIEVQGFRPHLRAGIHAGKPRRLGGDYFGVDVNVAARVAAAAGAGEVLVSEPLRRRIATGEHSFQPRPSFQAKGAPPDLAVYLAEPVGRND
jgi:adenylate cyclase